MWLATFLGFFTAFVTLTAISGRQDPRNVAALVLLTLFIDDFFTAVSGTQDPGDVTALILLTLLVSFEVFFCEQSQCMCMIFY